MFDRSQLMKGTLEGCILHIIGRGPTYGYEIAGTLKAAGFSELTEGTLYPLLLRLERKGLVCSEFRPSPSGPSRKYDSLTEAGRADCRAFAAAWREVQAAVETICKEDAT